MGAIWNKEKGCLSSIKLLVMVMLLMGVLFVDETKAFTISIPACTAYCWKHTKTYAETYKCVASGCIGLFSDTESDGAILIPIDGALSPQQQQRFKDFIDALSPQQQHAFKDYMDALSEGPSPQ